ncbi:hypothetical protein EYF80_047371 [Liparis tanakae]|uniref:Uncharacterized protein n=1 Tax=Liparis tanakae TaxID=230148 RepID=A0A4Z2FNJ5_9TELE|nr:hypothetical protein EYF80_047371 [Liparis tanakae]
MPMDTARVLYKEKPGQGTRMLSPGLHSTLIARSMAWLQPLRGLGAAVEVGHRLPALQVTWTQRTCGSLKLNGFYSCSLYSPLGVNRSVGQSGGTTEVFRGETLDSPMEREIMGFSGLGVSCMPSTMALMGFSVLSAMTEGFTSHLCLRLFTLVTWRTAFPWTAFTPFTPTSVPLGVLPVPSSAPPALHRLMSDFLLKTAVIEARNMNTETLQRKDAVLVLLRTPRGEHTALLQEHLIIKERMEWHLPPSMFLKCS